MSTFSKGLATKDICTFAHDETYTLVTYVKRDILFKSTNIIHFGFMNMEHKENFKCLFHFGFILNHTIYLDISIPEK